MVTDPTLIYWWNLKKIKISEKIYSFWKAFHPLKCIKLMYFFKKEKLNKKYVCLPYLKFSDLLPETHLFFFIWPNRK